MMGGAALAVLGACAGCLAGHAVSEARAYPSMRRAFLWDAVRNGLAGAVLFGLALVALSYA